MRENVTAIASAREALEYLQALRPIRDDGERDYYFFRGENKLYDRMLPSLFRVPTEQRMYLHNHVGMLASHFWSDYLEPSLQFRSEGPYLNNELLGDLHEIEEVRSSPSYLDTEEQFQPLFQHYGWPTRWLDITFDPAVALFFSSYDFKAGRVLNQGTGFIYYWKKSEVRQHPKFWFKPIVDLRRMARATNEIFRHAANRPDRQAAAGIAVDVLVEDHEDSLRELRHCVAYDRHDVQSVVRELSYYFPPDPLLTILLSWERQYIARLRRYAVEHPGEFEGHSDYSTEILERNQEQCRVEAARFQTPVDVLMRYQDIRRNFEYHAQVMRVFKGTVAKLQSPGGQLDDASRREVLGRIVRLKYSEWANIAKVVARSVGAVSKD